jgi:DNA-binding response OmpR family regulator/nitrogen-specific signal transduction histidine kinase
VTLRAHQLEETVRARTRELSEQRDTIKQQSERLEEAASAKDRLYANVSHEFRTPITVILGSLERVLQRDGAPDRRSYLETIRRNAQRLLRLVEQFMVLARLDAARVARPSPQPAGQRVSLLVESFRTLAEDKDISLMAKCEGLWVSCDADAFETIVVNLVSNAIKYTPTGGRVSVAVERIDAGYVDIVVSDTGIGIPTEQQAKVFDRFYRATDASEMAPGSGLGLALVRELVTANRGDIGLVSENGSGTTVRVRLREAAPLEAADVAKPSATAALEVAALELPPAVVPSESEDAGSAANGGVARALIVEDNQDLCRHLEKVLGREFRCDFANDGSSGIERAIETVPDVIICDVMLPSVNGFEVVRQLKHDDRTCHVPIILLTARADEESRLAGLGVLADDYVTKPFSEPELRQRVDRLLAIREILRQRYGRHAGDIEKLKAELGARDRRFVEKVEQVLDRHHTNAEFSLPEFASHLAMSERQLQRKLKALMNTTPRDHVRDYRLRKALRMIEAGERVSAVAFAVGFTSQSYFTSCFRAQFGMTPSEARARAEKPGAPTVEDGLS